MNNYSVKIGDKEVEYTVKEIVGFEEAVEAYHKIVECLFPDIPDMDKEGNITAFAPYMYDLAETYAYYSLFTDIDLSGVDNEDIWACSLVSDVMEHIYDVPANRSVIATIHRWVEQFVDDYKNRILAHQKANEFYDSVSLFLREQASSELNAEALSNLASKLNDLSSEQLLKTIIHESRTETK